MKKEGILKITEKTANKADVWKVLIDFESYPDWLNYILKCSGKIKSGNLLKMTLKLAGEGKKVRTVKVGTVVENKYLGLEEVSSVGAWWWNKEFVFRLVEDKEGGLKLCHEIYCNGMRFRWRKKGIARFLEKESRSFIAGARKRLSEENKSISE